MSVVYTRICHKIVVRMARDCSLTFDAAHAFLGASHQRSRSPPNASLFKPRPPPTLLLNTYTTLPINDICTLVLTLPTNNPQRLPNRHIARPCTTMDNHPSDSIMKFSNEVLTMITTELNANDRANFRLTCKRIA